MILDHFTHAPGALSPVGERAAEQRKAPKPTGTWVSVRGPSDWPSFRIGEGSVFTGNRHRIELAEHANILVISTPDEMIAFDERYACTHGPYMKGDALDWSAIAAHHDGIIISPFMPEMRWDERTAWYNGWDCASGCLWSDDCVASMRADPETSSVYTLSAMAERLSSDRIDVVRAKEPTSLEATPYVTRSSVER